MQRNSVTFQNNSSQQESCPPTSTPELVMCRSWTIRSFWTNPYKDSRVTSPPQKRFVNFLAATHRDLHRLSQGNRNDSLNAGHVGNYPSANQVVPVLSLCRSREKWTMNDERIIDLLATSAEPMQVTWKMNERWTKDLPEDSVGRWTKHWPEDTVGRWTIRSSAGYRSLDHFFSE